MLNGNYLNLTYPRHVMTNSKKSPGTTLQTNQYTVTTVT